MVKIHFGYIVKYVVDHRQFFRGRAFKASKVARVAQNQIVYFEFHRKSAPVSAKIIKVAEEDDQALYHLMR